MVTNFGTQMVIKINKHMFIQIYLMYELSDIISPKITPSMQYLYTRFIYVTIFVNIIIGFSCFTYPPKKKQERL